MKSGKRRGISTRFPLSPPSFPQLVRFPQLYLLYCSNFCPIRQKGKPAEIHRFFSHKKPLSRLFGRDFSSLFQKTPSCCIQKDFPPIFPQKYNFLSYFFGYFPYPPQNIFFQQRNLLRKKNKRRQDSVVFRHFSFLFADFGNLSETFVPLCSKESYPHRFSTIR